MPEFNFVDDLAWLLSAQFPQAPSDYRTQCATDILARITAAIKQHNPELCQVCHGFGRDRMSLLCPACHGSCWVIGRPEQIERRGSMPAPSARRKVTITTEDGVLPDSEIVAVSPGGLTLITAIPLPPGSTILLEEQGVSRRYGIVTARVGLRPADETSGPYYSLAKLQTA